MPRPQRIPQYGHHKPSGQARVLIYGRHIYLGPYGSPLSREKYLRLVAERFSPGKNSGAPAPTGDRYSNLSINELLVKYLEYANQYYLKNGMPTKEVCNIKDAARPVRALYSHTPASEFGPKALKAVRQHMIDTEDLSRGVINSRVNRIRRMFKWAVSEELVPPSVHEGLRTVAGLRYGRSDARETEPVHPVADATVNATLPHLSPQIADMVMLQRLTSMRPGDVVIMRPTDIDMSRRVWVYEPSDHKTKYRGHRRLIAIGPKGQDIVRRYLNRPVNAYLFSPREVMAWWRAQRQKKTSQRKTPVYPSELRRLERDANARLRRKPKRPLRDRYDTASYYSAVAYGIEQARKAGVNVPDWFPNQLRHARATEVRRLHGLEGAQVVLGHARADVTQVYAERNLDLALEIARKTG